MANVLVCEKVDSYVYGRKILATESPHWDFRDGGYILSPLLLLPECQISFWYDGSGGIKDPTGKYLADWDLQTREADVVMRDGRKYSLTNPYEPGGCDIFSDKAAFLNMVELKVATLHPELILDELRIPSASCRPHRQRA